MKYFLFLVMFLVFSVSAWAGKFPSCPWGTVWDGIRCVSICPKGYVWNKKGICIKKQNMPQPAGSPARCKKEDDYFATHSTGCQDLRTGLIWGQRSSFAMSFREAQNYCNRIEGKKNDWRLPEDQELLQVAGSTLAGSYFKFRSDEWFWSGTGYETEETYGYGNLVLRHQRVHLGKGFNEWVRVRRTNEYGEVTWHDRPEGHVICVRVEE